MEPEPLMQTPEGMPRSVELPSLRWSLRPTPDGKRYVATNSWRRAVRIRVTNTHPAYALPKKTAT
jgi:hypothetical protein